MSDPKHPIITFTINLNSDLISYPHPARNQTDQDLAQAQALQFDKLKTSYLPGKLAGENLEHKTKGVYTFTAYGLKAQYYVDTYTKGKNPLLTVTNSTYQSHIDES